MLARDELGDDVSWWLYEDNGLQAHPGHARVAGVDAVPPGTVADAGVPARRPQDGARKAAAVECYPSQLFALEDDWQIRAKLEAPAPEQFWRLAPPPAGWEASARA